MKRGPVSDGTDRLARLLRQQPWGLAIRLVALTGYGQEEDKRQAQEAGFDTLLIKPVDLAQLLDLLMS